MLIHTGLERTGSNYFCHLLNTYSNIIVLSDPPALYVPSEPYRIRELYNYYHKKVLNKEPISHSAHPDGTIFTDTAYDKYTGTSVMKYDNKNFVFGIRHVPLFLNKLDELIKTVPEATFCVNVRNPIYQIASNWGKKEGAILYKEQTDIIIRNLSNINLIRYEDMVKEPKETIDNILKNYNNIGKLAKNLEPSEPSRKHRHKFTQKDIDFIEYYTRENAEILGVWNK